MEYLNEEDFKDLDNFVETCNDTSAAIGELQTVIDAIDCMFMIPVRSSTVYVGELSTNGDNTLKDYEDMISMGLDLNEEELSHYHELLADYHELLADYEEMQNNSK